MSMLYFNVYVFVWVVQHYVSYFELLEGGENFFKCLLFSKKIQIM